MQEYGGVLAALINSVLVLAIVQILKTKVPKLKEKLPWLIPIIAGAIGPAVAAGQNYLSGLIGAPIDISPIAAIFTGGTAVAMHQVGKQATKEAAKQVAIILMIGAFGLSMSGCATTGSNTKLTEDQRARVILSGIEDSNGILFDAGKVFITAQPRYALEWKGAAVPAFDQVNLVLADLEAQGAAGQQITMQMIVGNLQLRVADIVSIYTRWGTVPIVTGGKPTPDQIALLVIAGLQGGSILYDEIASYQGGAIPTWEMIQAKNKLMRSKISAEMGK